MSNYLTPEDYEIAKENGISESTVYARFYNYGWSKKRSLTTPVKNNYLWLKHKDQCEQADVSMAAFYQRIASGMTPEKASSTPLNPNGRRLDYGVPKITQEVIKRAEANGISLGTLEARVYVYKWDVEKAVSTKVKTRTKGEPHETTKTTHQG